MRNTDQPKVKNVSKICLFNFDVTIADIMTSIEIGWANQKRLTTKHYKERANHEKRERTAVFTFPDLQNGNLNSKKLNVRYFICRKCRG